MTDNMDDDPLGHVEILDPPRPDTLFFFGRMQARLGKCGKGMNGCERV